jgi:hypothetical protein
MVPKERAGVVDATHRSIPLVFTWFAVFALCFQGIFYLFEYRNGDTLAPTYIKLQKDLVWAVVLAVVSYVGVVHARGIETLRRPYNLILIAFCIWIVAVKAHEAATYGTGNLLLLTLKNLVLYAAMVPLLSMLAPDVQNCLVRKMLVVFVTVAFVQAAFSAALFILLPEYAFWKNDPYNGFDPFVGLFSNPNRFGLFMNMGAATLCAVLVTTSSWRALLAATGLVALALSIFYSAALSQLIVYFGLLGYATIVVAFSVRWRALRLLAVMAAASLAIGLVGLNIKSPLPDLTNTESELAWDIRNLASMAVHGRTIDGEPFRFTSDSFVNRIREIQQLADSFGLGNAETRGRTKLRERDPKAPLEQRLFGRADHLSPSSQSQFAYLYFRYGLVGLFLFVAVLAIPAFHSLREVVRRTPGPNRVTLLGYHLCLAAFTATFLGDNGLLDFPTNFLFFFVLFANVSLIATKEYCLSSRQSHTVDSESNPGCPTPSLRTDLSSR